MKKYQLYFLGAFLLASSFVHTSPPCLNISLAHKNVKRIKATTKIVEASKQIKIKGFKSAYNPSIFPFEEGYLLSFRHTLSQETWISHIGVVLLNKNFEVVTIPQILTPRSFTCEVPCQAEDARFFSFQGKIFLIYNDNVKIAAPSCFERRDMFIAELLSDEGRFFLGAPLKLYHADKYATSLWQKNWVPFEWEDKLFFSYSIVPHEVLECNLSTGKCTPVYETATPNSWQFGTLRGGTSAFLEEGEYFSFFHSSEVTASKASKGVDMYHYYMGAYTFSAQPPFEVTKITPERLVGRQFYTHSPCAKRVVFPGGYVVQGDKIYVAYGKDDAEVWIATINKQKLKENLYPVAR